MNFCLLKNETNCAFAIEGKSDVLRLLCSLWFSGRAVAFDTWGLLFESSHTQNFNDNCIEMTKRKKRPEMAHLKISHWFKRSATWKRHLFLFNRFRPAADQTVLDPAKAIRTGTAADHEKAQSNSTSAAATTTTCWSASRAATTTTTNTAAATTATTPTTLYSNGYFNSQKLN